MKGRTIYREYQDEGRRYKYVLQNLEDFSVPDVDKHDVLIEVKACALPSLDSRQQVIIESIFKKPKGRLPSVTNVAGVVKEVGQSVTVVKPGDRIAGVLPLDSESSGCSDYCRLSEFDIVRLPDSVDFETAAASIEDGMRAYMALHYLGRINSGETVLVMDAAATGFGTLVVQLAHIWGAKVLAVVSSDVERGYLQKLSKPPEHIIELDSKSNTLCSSVLEETGKLGVDVIIDNGVRLFTNEEDSKIVNEIILPTIPTRHEIISCLAVGGRWITSHPQLQLDPTNSLQLFLRGASLGFLFEQSWNLSSARQGRWIHIVQDLMNKLAEGSLRPHIARFISFSDVLNTLSSADQQRFGKIVVRISNEQ